MLGATRTDDLPGRRTEMNARQDAAEVADSFEPPRMALRIPTDHKAAAQSPRGLPFRLLLQMIQELGQLDSMRGLIGAVRVGQLGLVDRPRIERRNDGWALPYARPLALAP